MRTKTIAALLSAVALLSADAAFACGGGYSAGHHYSVRHNYEKPHIVNAVTKPEAQSRAPAPANIATEPAPVAPSVAAGLADSSL